MQSLVTVARRMFGKFRRVATSTPTTPKRDRTIQNLVMLEDRTVPDAYVWTPAGQGAATWDNINKWFNETLNKAAVVAPGAGDTARFPAQVGVAVQVPDGTTVSVLNMEAGTGATLKLAGTFTVDSEINQDSGTIDDGILSFHGSYYRWKGGKRSGDDPSQDRTIIAALSRLKFGHLTTTGMTLDKASIDNHGIIDCSVDDGQLVDLALNHDATIINYAGSNVLKDGLGDMTFTQAAASPNSHFTLLAYSEMIIGGGRVIMNVPFRMSSRVVLASDGSEASIYSLALQKPSQCSGVFEIEDGNRLLLETAECSVESFGRVAASNVV